MTKLYGPRGTTHSSSYAAAKKSWPYACWIEGAGRYATVAYCRDTTVTLHETYEAAREALAFIDQSRCGGRCHDMHAVYDLAAGPLARVDDLDPEVVTWRGPQHANRVRSEATDRGRIRAARKLRDCPGLFTATALMTVTSRLELLQAQGVTGLEDLSSHAEQLWLEQMRPQS